MCKERCLKSESGVEEWRLSQRVVFKSVEISNTPLWLKHLSPTEHHSSNTTFWFQTPSLHMETTSSPLQRGYVWNIKQSTRLPLCWLYLETSLNQSHHAPKLILTFGSDQVWGMMWQVLWSFKRKVVLCNPQNLTWSSKFSSLTFGSVRKIWRIMSNSGGCRGLLGQYCIYILSARDYL